MIINADSPRVLKAGINKVQQYPTSVVSFDDLQTVGQLYLKIQGKLYLVIALGSSAVRVRYCACRLFDTTIRINRLAVNFFKPVGLAMDPSLSFRV